MNQQILNPDQIKPLGLQKLESLPALFPEVEVWKEKLSRLSSSWVNQEDPYAWLACVLALEGVSTGNFGVGALLVDPQGSILVQGHNKSFVPEYRTDLHAEMVVLNAWETAYTADPARKAVDYALYSSLEPCPMCLTRLLYSDIKVIRYVAQDDLGGMTRKLSDMPVFFQEISSRHDIAQSDCLVDLHMAAWDIMDISMRTLNKRIE